MKSITLRKIDGPLSELIKSKARSEGLSINKTVKKILSSQRLIAHRQANPRIEPAKHPLIDTQEVRSAESQQRHPFWF